MLSNSYCEELSKLQDDVFPFPFEEAKHILEFELKKPLKMGLFFLQVM